MALPEDGWSQELASKGELKPCSASGVLPETKRAFKIQNQ